MATSLTPQFVCTRGAVSCVILLALLVGTMWPSFATSADARTSIADLLVEACKHEDGIPATVWACKDSARANEAQKKVLLARHCLASKALNRNLAYCDNLDKNQSPVLTLALDHATSSWTISSKLKNKPIKFDVSGGVELAVGKRESVAVVLKNTNPLLYGFDVKAIADSDIAQLAQLKKLAEGIGGIISFNLKMDGINGLNLTSDCDDRQKKLLGKGSHWEAVQDQARAVDKMAGQLARQLQSAARLVQNVESTIDQNQTYKYWQGESTKEVDNLFRDLEKELDKFSSDLEELKKVCATLSTETIRDGALEVLSKWTMARKSRIKIDLFENRLRNTTLVKGNEVSLSLVGDEVLLRKPIEVPDFLNKRTVSVNVAANSIVAGDVQPEKPAELASSVVLRQKYTDYFNIGVAITDTDLVSPKYTAVAVADPDNDDLKVISRTGEETRSGKLALVADWRFAGQLCEAGCDPAVYRFADLFAFQFGISVDSSNPGLLMGLSLGYKGLRIGYGRTWQSVKILDGQIIGDVVTGSDAIRTRDTFESDNYWSLSVSFKTLALFSGG